jgi:hypothetical protein
VAISTVGVSLENPLDYHLFMAGFSEMVAQVDPAVVLCYGSAPLACEQFVEVVCYPTRWQGIRQARKQAEQAKRQHLNWNVYLETGNGG